MPGLTKKQRRMLKAIRFLKAYVSTYEDQKGCLDYPDSTFIDDVLYGLGIALDEKYKWAKGYALWKDELRKHLKLKGE